MVQTDSPASLGTAPAIAQLPVLLWLSAGFWLISGLVGIIPVVISIPTLTQASTSVLLFVAIATLSHLLSLAGAVQLFRRRQSAIPLLVVVYVLYIGALLVFSKSLATWSLFRICLFAISSSTIGYALLLKRKGMLS